MSEIKQIIDFLNNLMWNTPSVAPWAVVMLVGTGLFMTVRLGFIQLRRVGHALRVVRGVYDDPADAGDVSHFQALATALSATVGIGNIAGVATAIHYGGPGALFWMWVTGLLGTSLKYAECTLALKYRTVNPDGSVSGGPMYYMEKALGWKPLAVLFAGAASVSALGQGNSIQAFTIADQLRADFAVPSWVTGLVAAAIVGLVIIGGIRRIARVTQVLTPAMTLIYLAGSVTILALNFDKLPGAFTSIIENAFSTTGAVGGFAGSVFMQTMIWGVKRGIFSNEAGQGSAAIAHSAARTKEPVREGAVALLEPYIDTLIVCSLTGLCIIVTGAWTATPGGQSLNGSPMTAYAFEHGLPFLGGNGRYIVTAAVFLFGISTIIGWSYYGDRAAQYLFGDRAVMPYRVLYTVVIFIGCVARLEVVWGFGDFAIALMLLPNLVALIALSGETKRLTEDYFSRRHEPYVKR